MAQYEITSAKSFTKVLKELEAKLAIKVGEVNDRVTKAVRDCAVDCISRSVPRAPIESGDLRSAGFAKVNEETVATGNADGSITLTGAADIEITGSEVVAEIGYAGVPYARRQHEEIGWRHDRTDGYRRKDGTTVNMVAGGQAKYLESVIVENIDRYRDIITDAAKEGMGG